MFKKCLRKKYLIELIFNKLKIIDQENKSRKGINEFINYL